MAERSGEKSRIITDLALAENVTEIRVPDADTVVEQPVPPTPEDRQYYRGAARYMGQPRR